jgi:putative phage-type endonuclease
MIEQGTDAWKQMRLGRVTASRVSDVIARTKTGWGASRANYLAELVAERLTGVPAESYVNGAMIWGTEKEPEARFAYSFHANAEVVQVGFVPHPQIAMSGASPDGLIGDDGLVELKCPNTATHIDTLLGQKVPEKYVTQMQWQMACTERAYCDFVSYDPRLPVEMRLFASRVERDDKAIAEMETIVAGFLAELDEKVARLCEIYGRPPTVNGLAA